MARFKSVHDLKKESYLLVFMMNRMDSEGRLFTICEDGWDFVKFGGTTNIKSLYTMLHNLKKKGYVKNKSHGVWDLTDSGFLEAKYWYKECGHQRQNSVATSAAEENDKLKAENDALRDSNLQLYEKIANAEKTIANAEKTAASLYAKLGLLEKTFLEIKNLLNSIA